MGSHFPYSWVYCRSVPVVANIQNLNYIVTYGRGCSGGFLCYSPRCVYR